MGICCARRTRAPDSLVPRGHAIASRSSRSRRMLWPVREMEAFVSPVGYRSVATGSVNRRLRTLLARRAGHSGPGNECGVTSYTHRPLYTIAHTTVLQHCSKKKESTASRRSCAPRSSSFSSPQPSPVVYQRPLSLQSPQTSPTSAARAQPRGSACPFHIRRRIQEARWNFVPLARPRCMTTDAPSRPIRASGTSLALPLLWALGGGVRRPDVAPSL